jgi:hypothetical protein
MHRYLEMPMPMASGIPIPEASQIFFFCQVLPKGCDLTAGCPTALLWVGCTHHSITRNNLSYIILTQPLEKPILFIL